MFSQVPMFPVRRLGKNVDFSKPASSGEEFLARVRFEASQLPDTLSTSGVNPHDFDHLRSRYNVFQDKCLLRNIVPVEWKKNFLEMFRDLRQSTLVYRMRISSVRELPFSANDESYWRCFFLGSSRQQKEPQKPSLSFVSSLDSVAINTFICFLSRWTDVPLDSNTLAWMFHLLCCVDVPLNADVAAAMRSIWMRMDEVQASNEIYAEACVISIIVGTYFGQEDRFP